MDVTNYQSSGENNVQERLILEAAKDYAIFTTDLQRRIMSWNAGAENLFGYAEAQILGQSADILYLPEDRPNVPEREAKQAQTEGRAENERWHLRRNGSRIYGSGVVTPLRDETGTMVGLVKIMRDLTRQKQAEEARQQSEAQYRTLFNSIDEGFCTIKILFDEESNAVNYRVLETNSAFIRQTGLENIIGRTMLEFAPNHEPFWIDTYGHIAKTGEAMRFEHWAVSLGRHYNVYAFRTGEPTEHTIAILFNDITERKRQEDNLAFLAEVSRELIGLTNIEKTMNALGAKTGGQFKASVCVFSDIDEAAGTFTNAHVWHRAGVPSVFGTFNIDEYHNEGVRQAMRAGEIYFASDTANDPRVNGTNMAALGTGSFVSVPLLRDGQWRFNLTIVDTVARNWRNDEIELMRELTTRIWTRLERARAEESLRQSEEKFRTLFETIDEGVSTVEVIVDEQGKAVNIRYLENNPAVKKILGIELTVGKTIREVIPDIEEQWIDAVGSVARTGEPVRVEYMVESLDKWISAYFLRVGGPENHKVIAVYNDITNRKQNQQHQAFLLKFSDTLRTQPTADAIATCALQLLAGHLQLDRCYIGVYRLAEDRGEFTHQVGNDRVPPVPDGVRLSDFPDALRVAFDRTLVIDDVGKTAGLTNIDRQNLGALGFSALVASTLRHGDGNPLWSIVSISAQPRHWTSAEIKLIDEVTERTWTAIERVKVEESLRQSEEKFRTLFETMDEGFAICEGIRNNSGKLVDYRVTLLNPAYERSTGLKLKDALGKRALEIAPGMEDWWFETFQKVLDTGETARFEQYHPFFDRWYEVTAFRYTDVTFAYLYNDITERKRHEANLVILAEVSQALVGLTNINETMNVLGEKIGGHFNASVCAFSDVDEEAGIIVAKYDWHRADVPSTKGTYRIADYHTEAFRTASRAGETYIIYNTIDDPRVNGPNMAAASVGAYVNVPFVRDGKWLFNITVVDIAPRHWRADEIDLIRELINRIWTRLERARAEESLHQSQRFVQGIVTSLPLVIYLFDLVEGKNLFLSPQIMDVFGYQPNEMQTAGPNLLPTFFHPDDLPRIAGYFEQINRSTGDEVFTIECRMHHKQRGWIWVVCRDIVYARDPEGRPTQLLGTAEDITERKEAEQTLRRSDERFRTLVQNLPDYAIFQIDPDTIITEWTEGAQRVKGYTAQEAIGQPLSLFYTPENLAAGELTNEVEEASRNGRAERISVRIRKGGERFWVDEIMTAIHDEAGQITGFTKISRDITRRRQMEQALLEADRRKDEFLALLAHELRNPLATLSNTLLILELTGGKTADMNVPTATAMMTREVAQLTRLVDDLLDVSRISRGKLMLTFGQLDLTTLVSQAGEAVRAQFSMANRRLSITLPSKPTYLNGDAARLRQVISNLLTNALKFTNEDGYIGVSLEQANGQAVLRVQDDGIGIPPHELTRIFEMFAQVDSSVGRSQGGLGLGLTLVSELAKLHGGRVEAYSTGKGSTFTVYLPLELNQLSVTEQPKPESVPARKRQVLVVDDNHDAAKTLAMLLKLLGNEVHTRHDGLSGVEAAESLRPQVAILDISMPGMDGYQAAQRIREQPWGQHLMLIALSGYGQEEDKRRSREAGFDTHLVKPVDMSALSELLASLPSPK